MQFNPSYGKFVSNVKELLQSAVVRKERIHALRKDQLEKLAAAFGINDKNLTKELAELAVVQLARELAHAPGTVKQRFESIVELYNHQTNLSHRTSHSMLLQQYSTPAPIAYLMGVFCGLDKSGHHPLSGRNPFKFRKFRKNEFSPSSVKPAVSSVVQEASARFFEPSAGNGMLTIAARTDEFIVNDIDEVRNMNLQQQHFHHVSAFDATKDWCMVHKYCRVFDAVITNPPFGKMPEPLDFNGYKITELDHVMAIRALDTLRDNGRAAIIIGGNTDWDEQGRIRAGKNRMFFSYLYRFYNVLDVLNIDGKLYSRMGTSFNVRVILIDGRKTVPAGFPPLYSKTQDATIHDFETYYKRVMKFVDDSEQDAIIHEAGNKTQNAIIQPNAESLQLELEAEAIALELELLNLGLGNVKKLSKYTIAKYCSDIRDVKSGIEEMEAYFNKVAKPADTAYIRFYKLKEKLRKMEMEGLGLPLNTIIEFVRKALRSRNKNEKLTVEKVGAEAERIDAEIGLNVRGYKRVLDYSGIIHSFNNHGAGAKLRACEIPIEETDIALIPHIVKNAHKISRGINKRKLTVIIYEYHSETITYYVEEIRTGNKELTLNTMYKNKNAP